MSNSLSMNCTGSDIFTNTRHLTSPSCTCSTVCFLRLKCFISLSSASSMVESTFSADVFGLLSCSVNTLHKSRNSEIHRGSLDLLHDTSIPGVLGVRANVFTV